MKVLVRTTISRLVVGGVFLGVCAIALGDPGNADLIENGQFESGAVKGGLPAHWISYEPFPGAVVTLVEGQGRNGSTCGMVHTKSDQTAILVSDPPSPVVPGEELTVSGWCRVEGASTHSGGKVACSVGLIDANGRYFNWLRVPVSSPAGGGWFKVDQKVKVPARAVTATLQLGMRYMTGQVWWDDVALKGNSQVARFGLSTDEVGMDATTVPLLLINRLADKRESSANVRIEPGGQTVKHPLTGETVTTIPLPVKPSGRGKFTLGATIETTVDGKTHKTTTTQTLTVPPPIVAEPPSPTHWVIEDPGPARIEQLVNVNPGKDVEGATGLRCTVRNSADKSVASVESTWGSAPPPPNPIRLQIVLPHDVSADPDDYKITVELLKGSTVLATVTDDWHVIHRAQSRVIMGDDGYPVVDGKRLFPLGLYMGEGFPELARAGLNTMQSYPAFAGPGSSNRTAMEFLDRTHAAGMKALTFISHGADRLSDEEALCRIRMFRNHPATLMWYQEEVLARGYKPLSYVQNLYETLKREAPDHPVLQGDQRDKSSKLVNRSDTFPADYMEAGIWWWYPTPLREKPSVENYEGAPGGEAREYRPPLWLTDSGTSKPIWVALQSYKKPVTADARFPTPEEYRAQAYIAICHGAKGLMYYTGTGERGHGVQSMPKEGNWDYLKKLIGELKEMSPVFLAPDAPGKAEITPAGSLISTRLKQVGDKRVLIAVNRAERPADATIKLPAGKAGETTVRFEARNLPVSAAGEIKDRFAGYAVHIYDLP